MVALAKLDTSTAIPQKSNEWYTPARYIEAAREVMGSIDLDPASCELANRTVKATRFYSKEDNGLAQEWRGNVWLNPPFTGTHLREIWTQRLIEDYKDGRINQAILLMPNALDAQWFQPLWQFPICFPSSRIYFYQEMIHKGNPNFASCLVYLGSNEARFIDIFSEFGTVARRVSKPKDTPVTANLWEVK